MTNVTAELRQMLRDKFPPPEWAVAFEVQATEAEGGLRFADAIMLRTKKGMVEVHGVELKVSRADWLHEVHQPEKSMAARDLCDFWHVVAGGKDIVRPYELPPGEGLLVPHLGALVAQTVGSRFARPTETIDRALMAAFLRRLDPLEPRTYWQMRERRAEERGRQQGRNAKGRMERARLRRHPEADDGEELNLP